MKLTHDKHGETTVSTDQEARRLAQFGWRSAPEKAPVEEAPEEQPELFVEDELEDDEY